MSKELSLAKDMKTPIFLLSPSKITRNSRFRLLQGFFLYSWSSHVSAKLEENFFNFLCPLEIESIFDRRGWKSDDWKLGASLTDPRHWWNKVASDKTENCPGVLIDILPAAMAF